MNQLLQLKQDKAAHITAAQGILAKAEGEKRAMTAEERTEFDAKMKSAEDLQETIKRSESLAALQGTDTEQRSGGRTELQIHDRSLDKPFGREARSGETEKQRRARLAEGFGEQLFAIRQAAMTPHSYDRRLDEMQKRSATGASEAVPADGGFLIQPDFSGEILNISHETGQLFTRARNVPLSDITNAMKIPGIDEQSRATGSRWGGVRMYWQNEADAMTASKPKFRMIELTLKKLTGLFYSTDELLRDARALGSVVQQAFGEEVGFMLDDSVFRGDGSGKPQGVMSSPALITVNKETGQASGTFLWENAKKMWGRMWPRSRQNAAWFINVDVEQQLNSMVQVVGTSGVPVYLPPGGASAAPYGQLMGRPVIPIEQCDTLGNLGDVLLADYSQYVLTDKGGLESAVSMHVRFVNDEQTFRYIYRVDGQPIWHTPLTPFKGTNTLSPFVTLQAR